MSACEFVGSNVDFYVPLVLKRADLFLAADLFLECLELEKLTTLLARGVIRETLNYASHATSVSTTRGLLRTFYGRTARQKKMMCFTFYNKYK